MSASLNRPFEVKHFQTIRHRSVDVAHGPCRQSALGHRVSAQSRLVRPVYDLRAEAKDDGENFLLLFGANLILVQHIFKVPGHDFKITSSDAETMVRLLSGSANHFTRSAGHIAQ